MKGKLRKELRARRRGLCAADHALRSNLAASAITRLPAFRPGARVAVYLPFDRETNTAALLIAARRRRVRIYVPVIESRRYARPRFYLLSASRFRTAPRAAIASPRVGSIWWWRRSWASMARAGASEWVAGSTIGRSPSGAPGSIGAGLIWLVLPSSVSAPIRFTRSRTTSAWMPSQPSAAFSASDTPFDEH
jgi:hypothetical protein